jgi:hypothetical protein
MPALNLQVPVEMQWSKARQGGKNQSRNASQSKERRTTRSHAQAEPSTVAYMCRKGPLPTNLGHSINYCQLFII